MKGYPIKDTSGRTSHFPAANTAAVVVITPAADEHVAIDHLAASYGIAAPSGGRITIIDSASTVMLDVDTAAAIGPIPHPGPMNYPIIGAMGLAVTVTLAAGGGTSVGKLTVFHR